MKTTILKLIILLFSMFILVFLGMQKEIVLLGVIAFINVFVFVLYQKKTRRENYFSKTYPDVLNNNFSELNDLDKISKLFTCVSLLAIVMFFVIKFTYYGFDYIVFAFSQSIILLLALNCIEITFLVRLFILYESKFAKKDKLYIFEKTEKLFIYSQTSNVGLMVVMLSSAIMGDFVFSASQILIIRIMVDIITILTLYINGLSKNNHVDTTSSAYEPSFISRINLIKIVINGMLIAFFVLIIYRLGLNTGNETVANTMSFYAMLFINWSIVIGNWFLNRNTLKKLPVFAVLVTIPFIMQAVTIYFPKTDGLFRILQLSQNNWNRIIFFYLLLLFLEIMITCLMNATKINFVDKSK